MFTSPTEYRFAQFRFLVLSLCVLSVLCVETPSQDYKPVHDGVEYAELTREISGKQVKMNLLRLDLKKVRLDVHHAMDMAIGTEKTSSIATRHGAVAAINAGFFRLDKSDWAGESTGVLKVDGTLLSESLNNRVAVGFTNTDRKTIVDIGPISAAYYYVHDYSDVGEAVDGVNREPKPNEIILYTSGMVSPVTTVAHREIIVKNCQKECVATIEVESLGGNAAPSNGCVLVFQGEQPDPFEFFRRRGVDPTKVFVRLAFTQYAMYQDNRRLPFMNSEDIVAGVPQLIKNSKIDITWEQEKASKSFVETRHPRTAVAKLKDGKFLMVTVDGRSEESAGIDLYDLAKLLLEFGVTDAMNLDGGGSTTMFLDGKVVNKPSDPTGERKVGDAILVTLRKPKR